jgi:hypothetical protein
MATLLDQMFEEFKTILDDMFGNAIPAQDLDFIASLMFVDFMDRFFGVTLQATGGSGGSGGGGGQRHRHQMMSQGE